MGFRAVLVLILTLSASADAPDDGAIRDAVARGVKWLRKEQEANGEIGKGPGETALSLMALRHSGVLPTEKVCRKAARRLERALPDGTVYGAALGVLALLEQPRADHQRTIDKLVRHLVEGQCRNGQWTYAYRRTARKKAGDNSNTQVAVLALAAARVRRFKVPDEVFDKVRAFFEESQNEDGGFGYAHNQRTRSYASMTAGGAMALALCAGARPDRRFLDPSLAEVPAVRRSLAWLARDFDPSKNRGASAAFGSKKGKRGDAFWRHYWLWSLERGCSAAGARTLGSHDWYAEGARFLLETQRDDGFWRDPERDVQATCFALLFFARSTRQSLTPRAGETVTTPGGR